MLQQALKQINSNLINKRGIHVGLDNYQITQLIILDLARWEFSDNGRVLTLTEFGFISVQQIGV